MNIIVIVDRSIFSTNPKHFSSILGYHAEECHISVMSPFGTCVALRAHVIINTLTRNPNASSADLDRLEEWVEVTKMRLAPGGLYIDLKDYNARPHLPNPIS